MYLSELRIENFRQFGKTDPCFCLILKPGVTALVGANDCGKSAVVDAIRYALLTRDMEYIRVHPDDFYIDQNGVQATEITIRCKFASLTEDDMGAFAEHLTYEPQGSPVLYVHWSARRLDAQKGSRRFAEISVRSGENGSGPAIEATARQLLEAAYLRPLRDAEREMSPGPGSRLSKVLNRSPGIKAGSGFDVDNPPASMEAARALSLSAMVEYLTHLIHQHDGVTTAEATINKDYLANLALAGEKLQGKLNFIHGGTEEARLRQILERLQLDLLEAPAGTAKGKYGLGSNNLLYMACELLLLGKETTGFPLLLIEEPEAHLHPQRQLRLMQFLETASRTEISEARPVQVILTTHSPNLSSKIPLNNIVIVEGKRAFSLASGETKLNAGDYRFLERFLDVTKANLFFARGLLIVEGDAEAILLPVLARLIGRDLTEHGVSIVNVGGTGLRRYGRIMQRRDDSMAQLSVPVACLADMDVMPDCAPQILGLVTGDDDGKWKNPRRRWRAKRDFGDAETPLEAALAARHDNLTAGDGGQVQTFVADQWTFEYDLAYAGLSREVYVAARLAGKDDAICAGKTNVKVVVAAAATDFETLVTEAAGDNERLCSEIYALFARDEVSKAVAAQYLAEILGGKVDGWTASTEPLRPRLPTYIVDAIDFASRAESPEASPPAAGDQ